VKQFTIELSRTGEGHARAVMRDDAGHAVLIAEAPTSFRVAEHVGKEVWDQLRAIDFR
jgi:hypothetical protein